MGEKDFQQYYLVKKYLQKNNKSKILKCKTIRDKNGVACSTRNFNLNNSQLIIASNIYKYLFYLSKKIKINYKFFQSKDIKKKLLSLGATKIDYIENLKLKDLRKTMKSKNKFKLFFAYYINNIRLIDNI